MLELRLSLRQALSYFTYKNHQIKAHTNTKLDRILLQNI